MKLPALHLPARPANAAGLPGVIGLFLLVCLLAMFVGLLAVTGSVFLIGAFAGAGIGLALLFSPNLLFAATMLFAMVLGGLAEFYLHIGQANWISSGLAAALGASAVLAVYRKEKGVPIAGRLLPAVGPLVLLYVLALFSASLLSLISLTQLTVGIRNALPFLGVFLAIRYAIAAQLVERIPYALVWIGMAQLPFCLHQFVIVGAQRRTSMASMGGEAEAVNGTFGGNMLGFGYSGSMAVFVLIAASLALALRSGEKGKWLARLMPLAALACVGMAETKIVFVLAPPVLLLVFWEDIKASPRKLFGLLGGMGMVLGTLAAIYAYRFWSHGFSDFWQAFTYSFDPDFMVTSEYRGRVGTLIYWWNQNVVAGDIPHTLFGYGMGSTLEASRVLGVGSAVLEFGPGLDQHAASKLLWDTGVIGLVFFCWIAIRTGFNAHRLVRSASLSPLHVGMMKTSRGAMLAFLAMLPYQVSLVGEAPTQALFWLFVGYVAYWRHQYMLGNVKA